MEELFDKLNLGNIIKIEKIPSSQNSVYKIITKDNNYLLKEYSKDAIRNEEDLNIRIKQINISKVLNNNGILTILPIEFNNNFIHYNNSYYLIYKFLDYKVLKEEDLNNSYIEILAKTLASIHKLNLKHDLPIQYKKINIDYKYYLNKFKNKNYSERLYKLLKENKKELTNLIKKCNNKLPEITKNLCVSHNDYKLQNILWDNDKMYLIDFDATSLSNPIVSLAESAFALSRQNQSINYDFYRTYIKTYMDVYGKLNTNYNDALICAMNGKLQWFEYLLNNCNEDNLVRVNDCISMINELMLFINNKDKLSNI